MIIFKVSCLKPFPHSVNVCPTLVPPANGNLVLSGNTFGETANYTCNTVFILEGDSTLTCGGDGQWIGSSPVCNRKYLSKMSIRLLFGKKGRGRALTIKLLHPNAGVQCPTLVAPSNGRLEIAGPGGNEDVATYSCDTGFNLVGMPQRVCQSDGTWSGSEPTCEGKIDNF